MNTRNSHRLAVLLALISCLACQHGVRPENFDPAISPAGATISVRVRGVDKVRSGELFAVDSIGIMMLSERLLRIRWENVVSLDVAQLGGDFDISRLETVAAPKVARLALISRFPQGLEGAFLDRVLATLNQDSIDETGTPRGADKSGPGADPLSLDDLAAAAAHASERYADRRAAVADGYRRIGADFPAMGEHWLLLSAMLDGRIDPERPAMLTYANLGGRPSLVGTGYLITTRGREVLPNVPGWPDEWHEHSGFISEESGAHPPAPEHEHHSLAPAEDATRLWVLHIWTRLENPAGRYNADNWALPFARAGLSTHSPVDEASGRAFSLTVGGDSFLRAVLTDAGVRTDTNAAAVDAAIAAAREQAVVVAERARYAGGADSAHLESLRAAWRLLSEALAAAAGPVVMQYLASEH